MSDSMRPHRQQPTRLLGFPVPGILQARTLEWVAIAFSCHVLAIVDSAAIKLLHNETISKVKRQPSEWEKIIANETTDK